MLLLELVAEETVYGINFVTLGELERMWREQSSVIVPSWVFKIAEWPSYWYFREIFGFQLDFY